MQKRRSLNWLPRITSFGRKISFGFFSKILVLIFLISLIFVSPAVYGTVFAQTAQTRVYLADASTTSSGAAYAIIGGNNLAIAVKVDNVIDPAGLGGFSFQISYDPNLLTIVDADGDFKADTGVVITGPFLGTSQKQMQCSDGYIDQDPNSSARKLLTYTCVTLGPSPSAAKGSGNLATINFKTGSTLANTSLSFANAQLAANTADASIIPATQSNLSVVIAKCANFTGDHLIDILDIVTIINHYRSTNPADIAIYDLNGDGRIDIADIIIAIGQYRKTC